MEKPKKYDYCMNARFFIYPRITSYIILSVLFVYLVSCGGNTIRQEFDAQLERAVKDDRITKKEFNRLTAFLERAEESKTELAPKVTSEEDLVQYLKEIYPELVFEEGIEKETAVKLSSINIFLENSASMKGYFPSGGNVDFTNPIMCLFNLGNVSVNTAYIGQKVVEVDNETFQSQLANGKIANEPGSPLPEIFEIIIASTDVSQISCLITDGIMSGTNAEIKANREFNYNNRPVLQQRVRKAVEKARDKGLCVLIYRMESPFNGTYYTYRNTPVKLKEAIRPYYIFIFGEKRALEAVSYKLGNERAFSPTHTQLTGIFPESVTNYKLKPEKGQEYVADKTSITYKSNPGKDAKFGVRADLSGLPSYILDPEQLEKYATLTLIYSGSTKESDYPDLIESVEVADEKNGIYQFNIEMPQALLQKLPVTVRLTLPMLRNPWYKSFSLDNDVEMNNENTKTFALDYLMDGIINGMEPTASVEDFMKIEVPIKKR